MKKVYIFWTGGWDSTYRMVELSQMEETEVFPVYVMDTTRPSLEIEKETIQKLWRKLDENPRTVAKIHPVTWIREDQIPEYNDISEAYTRLQRENKFGSQYEYLAKVARLYPGIEVCITKITNTPHGCSGLIYKYGKIIAKDDTYVVDPACSNQDIILLFGNISFPLAGISKQEMLQNIIQRGYSDLMQGIHFCYFPRHNEPCGVCSPCIQKMSGGLEFLIPKRGQFRYRVYTWRLAKASLLRRIVWRLTDKFI